MQQDALTKNFHETYRGKAMQLMIEEHKYPVNGVCQEMYYPNALVESKYDPTTDTIKQVFFAQPTSALTTINLVSWSVGFNNAASFLSTTYPVPAGTHKLLITQTAV
jgi:hypothetical protein